MIRAVSPALVLALAGTLVFLNVYAPQALLPLLAHEFGATPLAVGSLVGATTLAIALVSPLAGVLADAAGRKRVMVAAFLLLTLPCLLATQVGTLAALNLARFLQGLLIPLVMVTASAYAAEEFGGRDRLPGTVAQAISAYVTGTVLGGFAGRFISGLVASGGQWRLAFWVLVASNLLGALLVGLLLPHASHFTPARDLRTVARDLRTHLHNRALLGTLAVGFCLLFTLVAAFTYVVLRLAAAPYRLGTGALGGVFAVYLLGVVVTPLSGRLLARTGPARGLLLGAGLSVSGLLLTLATPLWLVILGLALGSCGVFISQSAALGAVQTSVTRARSLATGLYNLAYYGGGAVATLLGGLAYTHLGWPGVVACCTAAMGAAAAIGRGAWRGEE